MIRTPKQKCLRIWFPVAVMLGAFVFAEAPEGFEPYEGLKEQFTLALPGGWSVFNQIEVLTGNPGTTGPVAFSSEEMDVQAMTSGDEESMRALLDQLAAVEVGAVNGFLLDRLPAKKGMSCDGFKPKAETKVLDLMSTDPMFGPGRTTHEKPHGEPAAIGGCQGLRFMGKGEASTGDPKMLDVVAVSDGRVLYLFKLLNLEENYSKNVGAFERVLSTVEITVGSGGKD